MDLLIQEKENRLRLTLRRVGSVLVCMSLLISLAFPPQPVQAVVVADDVVIVALVAAFLAACGITLSARNMSSDGVKNQVGVMIDQFLAEKKGGISRLDWLGTTFRTVLSFQAGRITLPRDIVSKLSEFAQWVKSKFNLQNNVSDVPISSNSQLVFDLSDGSKFSVGAANYGRIFDWDRRYYSAEIQYLADAILPDKTVTFQNGFTFSYSSSLNQLSVDNDENKFHQSITFKEAYSQLYLAYGHGYDKEKDDFLIVTYSAIDGCYIVPNGCFLLITKELFLKNYADVSESMSIDTAEISIPDTIPEAKQMTIVTGATDALTLDDALERILAAIAAGQLTATGEITDAQPVTDDPAEPVAEDIPDVGELGLPALANTLTSRFPFSIPWDVAKAVKLLAAPPKTPRFEVDFMAPIAYRFGGKLGNTKIVLDFSQYEIIGQVSRWTSTIGFCLMLASGTKKLIWTA